MKFDCIVVCVFLLESYVVVVGVVDLFKIVVNFFLLLYVGGKMLVVGVGKVVVLMVLVVEQVYVGCVQIEGVVVMCYVYGLLIEYICVIEVGYLVLDEVGEKVVQEILDCVCVFIENDCLIVLVFGGGFSLLFLLVEGILMVDLKVVICEFLCCGVLIIDMNIVCKYLLCIQGGWLVVVFWVLVMMLIVFDVVGDDLSVIVSGLIVLDVSIYVDVFVIIKCWGVQMFDIVCVYF